MFDRLIPLIGKENLTKISKINIAIIGIGGVGGFVLESLVRTGIKNIAIFDGDNIDITNINRQIITNSSNISKSKVAEAKKHCDIINPDINIVAKQLFINENNVDLLQKYDYVIDACDDINAKVAIIKYCLENKIKIISSLGTGKRLNPTTIEITKLTKTKNDALARALRQRLRKAGVTTDIPVVYNSSLPLNNDVVVSSSIFSPAVAGIYLAYYVISDIIREI